MNIVSQENISEELDDLKDEFGNYRTGQDQTHKKYDDFIKTTRSNIDYI